VKWHSTENYYITTTDNSEPYHFSATGVDWFEFRFWSGARDLNPGPHGPELCDISSKNGGNDRFLFEIAAERQSDVSIWSDLFAGLLHELLHGLSSST
jgi:hypothetical protein